MANIVDYVREQKETFVERPLNRVDSLVLSWFAYMRIPEEIPGARTKEGVYLATLADDNPLNLVGSMHDPESSIELLKAAAISPRFSELRICMAVEHSSLQQEKQFAAMTFALPDGSNYIAYRGTDNTLLGWKEDFNMAFATSVPAQVTSQSYLMLVAAETEGPLYVGGHSKGGNLAVYATMKIEDSIRDRILRCFSHDGPGFTTQTTSDPSWRNAPELVDKTVPAESLIGLLFEDEGVEPMIVKSTNPGVMQHAPFSWVVEGKDFAIDKALSYESYRTNKRIEAWLGGMTVAERERFIEILYKVVLASGEVTFTGLTRSVRDGSLSLMLSRITGLLDDDRRFFLGTLEELVATVLLGPASDYDRSPKSTTETVAQASSQVDDITARFNDSMAKWERFLGQ
ncbi:MAG: DUF2974 domain-containing protein [Atopobiaceae bacterium]|nr:DUF2974 domain-containing protein [Atopobiaceae bacterium]